jgi:phospholipase A-2-activating protein
LVLTYPSYSVLFAAEKSADKAMTLLEQIVSVANTEIDAETMYRNLVTLGTLLTLGGEIKQAAALYEVRAALKSAVSRVKDPRFPRLVAEIEKLL